MYRLESKKYFKNVCFFCFNILTILKPYFEQKQSKAEYLKTILEKEEKRRYMVLFWAW